MVLQTKSYPEVARGVADETARHDYSLFLCNKDRTPEKEQAAMEALLGKNVDGILLYKPRITATLVQEIKRHAPSS